MAPRKTVLSKSLGFSRETQVRMLTAMFAPKIHRFFKNQFFLPLQWVKMLHVLDSKGMGWTLNLEALQNDIYYQVRLQHRTLRSTWSIHFKVWQKDHEAREKTENLSFNDPKSFYKMVFFLLVRLPKCTICTKSSKTKFIVEDFMVGRKSVLTRSPGWRETQVQHIIDTLELTLPTKSIISKDFLLDEETFLVRFLNGTQTHKKSVLTQETV